jgi:pimeloyl-ACP methyl ester carboxylesterase
MWEGGGAFDGLWGSNTTPVFPPFITPFREAGYRCFVLLLPGYDGDPSISAEEQGKVSFGVYLAAVRERFEFLDRPIVIGHSLGGLLAQKLMEHASPPAVVLIAPAAPQGISALCTWKLRWFALKYGYPIVSGLPLLPSMDDMNLLVSNGLPAEDGQKLYSLLQPASGRQAGEISMPLVGGIDVAVNRAVPVAVCYGGRDEITPLMIAEKVIARYGATPFPYPDRAHMLMLEPGSEQVAHDILSWLEATLTKNEAH